MKFLPLLLLLIGVLESISRAEDSNSTKLKLPSSKANEQSIGVIITTSSDGKSVSRRKDLDALLTKEILSKIKELKTSCNCGKNAPRLERQSQQQKGDKTTPTTSTTTKTILAEDPSTTKTTSGGAGSVTKLPIPGTIPPWFPTGLPTGLPGTDECQKCCLCVLCPCKCPNSCGQVTPPPPIPTPGSDCDCVPMAQPCYICPCFDNCQPMPANQCPCPVDLNQPYSCPEGYNTGVSNPSAGDLVHIRQLYDDGYRLLPEINHSNPCHQQPSNAGYNVLPPSGSQYKTGPSQPVNIYPINNQPSPSGYNTGCSSGSTAADCTQGQSGGYVNVAPAGGVAHRGYVAYPSAPSSLPGRYPTPGGGGGRYPSPGGAYPSGEYQSRMGSSQNTSPNKNKSTDTSDEHAHWLARSGGGGYSTQQQQQQYPTNVHMQPGGQYNIQPAPQPRYPTGGPSPSGQHYPAQPTYIQPHSNTYIQPSSSSSRYVGPSNANVYIRPNAQGGGYVQGPTGGGYVQGPTGGGYVQGPTAGGYAQGPSGGGYVQGPSSGAYAQGPPGGGYAQPNNQYALYPPNPTNTTTTHPTTTSPQNSAMLAGPLNLCWLVVVAITIYFGVLI